MSHPRDSKVPGGLGPSVSLSIDTGDACEAMTKLKEEIAKMTDETTEKKPRVKRTLADRAAELRASAEKAVHRAVDRERAAEATYLDAVKATKQARAELASLSGPRDSTYEPGQSLEPQAR